MKCPNCNAENAEGMKFCGECGTKLPETESSGGLNMGDKNVIAGDVVSNVSNVNNVSNVDNSHTTVNTTNNTTVINIDETAKLAKCHICGSLQKITTGYECPVCHEYTCNSCFNLELKVCTKCVNAKKQAEAEEKIMAENQLLEQKSAQKKDFVSKFNNNPDSLENDVLMEYLSSLTAGTQDCFSEFTMKVRHTLASRYYSKKEWSYVILVYENNLDIDSFCKYGSATDLYDCAYAKYSNKDYAGATQLYLKAGDKGVADGYAWAAISYRDGAGLDGSKLAHADTLLDDSVRAKSKMGQYIKACVLEFGNYLNRFHKGDKNIAKARELYELSAAQGYEPAIKRLAELKQAEEAKRKEEEDKKKTSLLKEERKLMKIKPLLDKYNWDEILTRITHHNFVTNEYWVTAEDIKQLFPDAFFEKIPFDGTYDYANFKLKSLLHGTKQFYCPKTTKRNDWLDLRLYNHKVKKGDAITVEGIIPQITYNTLHENLSKLNVDTAQIKKSALYTKKLDNSDYYIGFYEKGEEIFSSDKTGKISAPNDGFTILYETNSGFFLEFFVYKNFYDYCEECIYKPWIENKENMFQSAGMFETDEISFGPFENMFDINALPEPYYCIKEGINKLYILNTNPGVSINEQGLLQIKKNFPDKSYNEVSDEMAKLYMTPGKISATVQNRIKKAIEFAEHIGCDGVENVEAFYLHSENFNKSKFLSEYFEKNDDVRTYYFLLRDFLLDKKVLAITEIDTKNSITIELAKESEWVMYIANLMKLDLDMAELIPVTENQGKVTSAVVRLGDKYLVLVQESNTLPADICKVL